MLGRLIFPLLLALGIWVFWTFRKLIRPLLEAQAAAQGQKAKKLQKGFTIAQLKEIESWRKNDASVEKAWKLREQILSASGNHQNRDNLQHQVDSAMLRLVEQVDLKVQIKDALKNHLNLKGTNLGERRVRLQNHYQSLEETIENTLSGLANLHLAILDVNASKAILDENQLDEALHALQLATDGVRHEAVAQSEIRQLLRAKSTQATKN